MAQAGNTSFEEAGGDPCYGISDFSDEQLAKEYADASRAFYRVVEAQKLQGSSVPGLFEFTPHAKCVKVQA